MTAVFNQLFKQPIGVTKFIIGMTLFNILIYHYPLFSFALHHLDIASGNGVLTFFALILSLFVITSVVMHLLALFSVSLEPLANSIPTK